MAIIFILITYQMIVINVIRCVGEAVRVDIVIVGHSGLEIIARSVVLCGFDW